ncbi:hypothetical protein [Xenorhabdus bovienii]|uniref:hypothetical protein n=1 Tax=Xenorhabdus bovienii TaxID=40576 RepID=UPI0023B2E17F|nr:hypothetical protein [Xenorhabdus bovienii]MDE9544173.1 hypothetical protein [Xenorhabdus bovienii]
MKNSSENLLGSALWVIIAYYTAIPIGLAISMVVILTIKGFDIISPYTVFFLIANIVLIILWLAKRRKDGKSLNPILKSVAMTFIGLFITVFSIGATNEFGRDIPEKKGAELFSVAQNNLAEIIPYLGIAFLIMSILFIVITILEDYESERE